MLKVTMLLENRKAKEADRLTCRLGLALLYEKVFSYIGSKRVY